MFSGQTCAQQLTGRCKKLVLYDCVIGCGRQLDGCPLQHRCAVCRLLVFCACVRTKTLVLARLKWRMKFLHPGKSHQLAALLRARFPGQVKGPLRFRSGVSLLEVVACF